MATPVPGQKIAAHKTNQNALQEGRVVVGRYDHDGNGPNQKCYPDVKNPKKEPNDTAPMPFNGIQISVSTKVEINKPRRKASAKKLAG